MNQIIPISWPEHCQVKTKKFIINDIICVGFSIVQEDIVSVLFAVHQDLGDNYEYINISLSLESPGKDMKQLMTTGMYIKDLQKDPNTKLQLQEMTKYLKLDNLFTVDMNITYDEEKKFYTMKGVRSTGKTSGESQEYQLNLSMYLMIRLFKEFVNNNVITNTIFLDNNLKTIYSITPIYSKLDGTIIEKIVSAKNKATFYQVTSHYTFTNGPTSIKVNYRFKSPKEIKKALREPMVYDQYQAQYSQDKYIVTTLYEDRTDEVLCIIPDQENTKTILVRLSKELYDKTNLNHDFEHYIFYDGVETESNMIVPHVKF